MSFNLSPEYLLAAIIFGAVGWAALVYGWKTRRWKPLVIGIALSVYLFFISDTLTVVLIGCALTAALFVFHD